MKAIKWLFRKIPITIGYLVLLALLFLLVFSAYLYYYIYHNRKDLPDITPFVEFDPPVTGEIHDLNGKVIIGLAKEYRRINKYSDIPPVVREAMISAEDKRFFGHKGIDWLAILQASVYSGVDSLVATAKSWEKRHYTIKIVYSHGGSTLDQQIVKLYFQKDKTDTLWKKIDKMRLAVYLNEEMAKRYGTKAKEEIFVRFASFVYLGAGRYGLDAGAEYFYGKRVSDFGKEDAGKAAFLAGLVRHPFPSKNAELRKYFNRRNEVLKQMLENGYISEDGFEDFSKKELILLSRANSKTIAPSAVGDILDELNHVGFSDMQFFEGRISVFSTIDLRIQEIANQALENGLAEYENRHPEARGLIQGSVVVLRNNDGAILAEVGGLKTFKSKLISFTDFNRIRHSYRQPGSVFKPLVYLADFNNGGTLEDMVLDAPIPVAMGWIQIGNKWVRRQPKWIANYDGKYKGKIKKRKALAESRNVPAVRTAKNIGMDKIAEVAKIMGIKTPLCASDRIGNCLKDTEGNSVYYITTALGASEVSLLELTNAYRAMASERLAEPYVVSRVSNRYGETIFFKKNTSSLIPDYLVSQDAIKMIQEGLRGVVRIPGGTAHSLDYSGFPIVMGKTGTTNDFKDAWFIGSTFGLEGITIGVKIGFDDPSRGFDEDRVFGVGPGRGLGDKETGGRTALPVFREMILGVYNGNILGPVPSFSEEIEKNIDNYLRPQTVK